MSARSSLRAVAERAGTSVTTVSRVLSGSAIPTEATRQKVLEAANALNYQADPVFSRAMRRRRHGKAQAEGQTGQFALLMTPDVAGGGAVLGRTLTAIEAAARQHQCSLVLHTLTGSTEVPDAVSAGRVDGVLYWGDPTLSAAAYIARQVPCVAVDGRIDGFNADSVTIDAQRLVEQALAMLWELGHRQIFLMPLGGGLHRKRLMRAFHGYFEDRDLPHPLHWQRAAAVCGGHVGAAAACDAFLEQVLLERPTAVLAPSLAAHRIISRLSEEGHHVPADISVVGIDDDVDVAMLLPKLTAARVPRAELGEAAVRLLLDRLQTPEMAVRHLQLEGQMVPGETCAAAAAPPAPRVRPLRAAATTAVKP